MIKLFPTKGGISDSLIPKTIISGEALEFKKQFRLKIVQYCQVHEEESPHNSKTPRTKGAICLCPSGNLQGEYNFTTLKSGKKIVQNNWDLIPMPDTDIARVKKLGSNQPKLLTFTDRQGCLVGDVETPVVGSDSDEGEV